MISINDAGASGDVRLGGGAEVATPARLSERRDHAPLFLTENLLRGTDLAGHSRRRGGNAISLADHFHGLALMQVLADSAISHVSLAVHEARNRARERLGSAQHLQSVLLRAGRRVRGRRESANQNQGSQHLVSIVFFGERLFNGPQGAAPHRGKQELRQLARLGEILRLC